MPGRRSSSAAKSSMLSSASPSDPDALRFPCWMRCCRDSPNVSTRCATPQPVWFHAGRHQSRLARLFIFHQAHAPRKFIAGVPLAHNRGEAPL